MQRTVRRRVHGLPAWLDGVKNVPMVHTVYVKFRGKRDNGELFLTPSSEDRLQVAALAKGNQLFYGSWRRHEVAYVSENGKILKFVYPAGKAPTTGEKLRHEFFQSLPFVKRSDEPV